MRILVSACLLGVCCRYNGGGEAESSIVELMQEHELIPVCPEIMGGLPTPRTPAERIGEQVITKDGQDVTEAYQRGAAETLKLARRYDCTRAILKERSPSCGSGRIYDGTFSGKQINGYGVTAELLEKNGIQTAGESNFAAKEGFL